MTALYVVTLCPSFVKIGGNNEVQRGFQHCTMMQPAASNQAMGYLARPLLLDACDMQHQSHDQLHHL